MYKTLVGNSILSLATCHNIHVIVYNMLFIYCVFIDSSYWHCIDSSYQGLEEMYSTTMNKTAREALSDHWYSFIDFGSCLGTCETNKHHYAGLVSHGAPFII